MNPSYKKQPYQQIYDYNKFEDLEDDSELTIKQPDFDRIDNQDHFERPNLTFRRQNIIIQGQKNHIIDEFGEMEAYLKEKQIRSNLKVKFSTKIEGYNLVHLEYLNLKQGRSTQDHLNSYILFGITKDSKMVIIDMKGNVQNIYDPGHEIYKWTYLNQGEEYLISTLGYDWVIKNHQIKIDIYEKMVKVKVGLQNTNFEDNEQIQEDKVLDQEEVSKQKKQQSQQIKKNKHENKQPQYKEKRIYEMNSTVQYESEFNLLDCDFFSNDTSIRNVNKIYRRNRNQNETDEPKLSKEQILQQRIEQIPFNIAKPKSTQEFISSFQGYFAKYNKMFLLGDVDGQVHAFYKNGTRHGKSKISNDPIQKIEKHYPQPLYISKNTIGFFNSHNLQIANPQCEKTPENIVHIDQESQHSQTLFALQEDLQILVYESKNQKQNCQILLKLDGNDFTFGNDYDIKDFRMSVFSNFFILSNIKQKKAKVINITEYRSKPNEIFDDTGFYFNGLISSQLNQQINADIEESKIIQADNDERYLYTSQKHSSNLAYISYSQTVNNNTYVFMYELFVESPGFSFNFFENVRFPMILIAVFVLFLIKFWKKDKKDDYDGEPFSKSKIDQLINDFSKKEGKNSNNDDNNFEESQQIQQNDNDQSDDQEQDIGYNNKDYNNQYNNDYDDQNINQDFAQNLNSQQQNINSDSNGSDKQEDDEFEQQYKKKNIKLSENNALNSNSSDDDIIGNKSKQFQKLSQKQPIQKLKVPHDKKEIKIQDQDKYEIESEVKGFQNQQQNNKYKHGQPYFNKLIEENTIQQENFTDLKQRPFQAFSLSPEKSKRAASYSQNKQKQQQQSTQDAQNFFKKPEKLFSQSNQNDYDTESDYKSVDYEDKLNIVTIKEHSESLLSDSIYSATGGGVQHINLLLQSEEDYVIESISQQPLAVLAENIKKPRVIVIVDSVTYQISHSNFFDDLRQNGYQVEFGNFNSVNLKLSEYGEYLYDHMIILSTTQASGKGLTQRKILDFFDAGKNVFVAGNIDASKFLRQLYSEFGVEFDKYGSQVYDDFNTPDFSIDHNIIHTTNQEADLRSFGPKTQNPILYRGSALKLSPKPNHQRWGILKGENTTYSYDSVDNKQTLQGEQTVLVAAVQGKNNARVVLTGSLDLLSNEFYKRNDYSNREYINNLLLWNFNENGLLKVDNIRHHKEGETDIPFSYKVEEQIYYYMDIYRWNHTNQEWVPYICNDHKIMLEFIMLDPYYRLPLEKKIGSPTYQATFKAPDQHGVFQFKVDYQRPGYTFLDIPTIVPVRPPKHTEFERFLQQAYPYYLSVLLALLGFFIFLYFFLYDKDNTKAKKE